MLPFFFFNDTATTEIYTLSLHDALPICRDRREELRDAGAGRVVDPPAVAEDQVVAVASGHAVAAEADRKSTRLNSSHANISYAVFCLKKKICPETITQL